MISDLKKHYKNLLAKHGPSPEAVQHINKESQYKRFEVLSQIDSELNSVIDLGCGLGDMFQYLDSNNFKGKYLGLDFMPEFIALSTENFSEHQNTQFKTFDLMSEKIPTGFDYILLSGVFNNNQQNNEEFMLTTIKKMFESCEKGIAFNAMSTYVDFQDNNLYYSDPLKIFDYCKRNLTRRVVLKHDYLVKEGSIPFEYTIFLYKEERV